MREKMKTPRAKEIYALRSRTVEPVFGDIKENKGLTSFLTRGRIHSCVYSEQPEENKRVLKRKR
jgi:hypothetical protein